MFFKGTSVQHSQLKLKKNLQLIQLLKHFSSKAQGSFGNMYFILLIRDRHTVDESGK